MFFTIALAAFVAFPESENSLLSKNPKLVSVETSGSMGLIYYNDNSCHQTSGNNTVVSDEKSDWCSNIVDDLSDPNKRPYLQFSTKGKYMKVSKYSLRNGCCYYPCCDPVTKEKLDDYCCCYLYSFSLKASNDKKSWVTLHKTVKDREFYVCQTKTYEIKADRAYKYFRLVLDEEYPNCPKCMQINQIELYGETIGVEQEDYEDSNDDEDESISIIGRVKRSE